MRLRLNDERGSISAEFAMAMPAFLACLLLCLSSIMMGAQKVQATHVAASAARVLGRGQALETIHLPQQVQVDVTHRETLICARVSYPVASRVQAFAFLASAEACAIDESYE